MGVPRDPWATTRTLNYCNHLNCSLLGLKEDITSVREGKVALDKARNTKTAFMVIRCERSLVKSVMSLQHQQDLRRRRGCANPRKNCKT